MRGPRIGMRTSCSPMCPRISPGSTWRPACQVRAHGANTPAAGLTTSLSAMCRPSPSSPRPCGRGLGQGLHEAVELVRTGDRHEGGAGDGALGHSGQHRSGPQLDEAARIPVSARVCSVWRQRTGEVSWRPSSSGPLRGAAVRADRRRWRPRPRQGRGSSDGVQGLGEAVGGRGHEGGVEGSGRREAPWPLFAPRRLAHSPRPADSVGLTGDHDLTRGVEVGDPDVALGGDAGGLHEVVVEAQHRSHGARRLLGRHLHGFAPLGHQADTFCVGQRARRDQCGVLAQAVAGHRGGGCTQAFDGVQDDQAEHEGGELGVAGGGELVVLGVKEQFGHVTPGDVAGLFDQLPGGVVTPGRAHARALRPLAGEGEHDHLGVGIPSLASGL